MPGPISNLLSDPVKQLSDSEYTRQVLLKNLEARTREQAEMDRIVQADSTSMYDPISSLVAHAAQFTPAGYAATQGMRMVAEPKKALSILGEMSDPTQGGGGVLAGMGPVGKVAKLEKGEQVISSLVKDLPIPSPSSKTVRLFRVDGPPSSKLLPGWLRDNPEHQKIQSKVAGRWFAQNPDEVEWYLKDAGEGAKVSYIDVPLKDLEKYRVSNQPGTPQYRYSRRPETEFFVPSAIAANRKPIP